MPLILVVFLLFLSGCRTPDYNLLPPQPSSSPDSVYFPDDFLLGQGAVDPSYEKIVQDLQRIQMLEEKNIYQQRYTF